MSSRELHAWVHDQTRVTEVCNSGCGSFLGNSLLSRQGCGVVCALCLRYIGESYSQAQEAMEDSMREFYSVKARSAAPPVLLANRLYAVRVEEDEVLRAQVCEVTAEKVKVRKDSTDEL